MSKKIVAFGASNSKQSINKKLANFAAHQIPGADVNLLDLNDFEMPIYSMDREKELGIPDQAIQFKEKLRLADGIIISFAEHNGSYSTAFKNILDWISRIGKDIWESKPMFLLAASPGGRGGQTVLSTAASTFKFMNQNTITSFSLPSFNQNFSKEEGITNDSLYESFRKQLQIFVVAL